MVFIEPNTSKTNYGYIFTKTRIHVISIECIERWRSCPELAASQWQRTLYQCSSISIGIATIQQQHKNQSSDTWYSTSILPMFATLLKHSLWHWYLSITPNKSHKRIISRERNVQCWTLSLERYKHQNIPLRKYWILWLNSFNTRTHTHCETLMSVKLTLKIHSVYLSSILHAI